MLGKTADRHQRDLFRPMLIDFIDRNHELVLLANKIDWAYLEKEFSKFYSDTGKPSEPIRLMAGCLILKQMYNLGDETVAEAWVTNPYMQYFCGEAFFRHKFPCDPSDFVHFRRRIGEEGVNIIFQHSIRLHGKDAEEDLVVSDTTVQGNNTTFPTDAKLYKKVIDRCVAIARLESLPLRQSYSRVSKSLVRQTQGRANPKKKKVADSAQRKLRTIAGRLVRELARNLSGELLSKYADELGQLGRVLSQTKDSKDKVYSLHKPYTACIAKGKASHNYEFGNKVGLVATANAQIIVAIQAFPGNPNDSRTIEPLVAQMQGNGLKLPGTLAYDRGGRGPKEIHGVNIITPGKPKKSDSKYERAKKRKPFRRRAAIEPLIGHLKSDFRMQENFLKGMLSSTVNAMLSATAWNLKKLMRKLKDFCLFFYYWKILPNLTEDESRIKIRKKIMVGACARF